MFLLLSYKNLEPLNKWAKTSSATEFDDAAGVFITNISLDFAYSTSMLSIPTPPRPTIFKDLHLSIRFFLT